MTVHFPFDNTYARLPDRFYARLAPTSVSAPKLIRLNRDLALQLRLDPERLSSSEGVELLCGNRVPDGAEPIAMAYAGHQFGNFVPQLGDGRAILLGEVVDQDGIRRDIQLKGSGPTPFSRRGDGRAALGPVLREYLISEAMAALGVPTTRALAAVLTGETVVRETLLPGAVLTRVASSHIRVGTFQFFAARQDVEGLRLLADYVIGRYYPEAAESDRPYRTLLDKVIAAQADLIARWLHIGFVHGVMNTDNMSIAGETIDYGPCAFMDTYDPATVFSSIDQHGRYAYGNQPRIGLWNLTRLAETLLPLLSEDQEKAVADANAALEAFSGRFEAAYHTGLRRKLGLLSEREEDLTLAGDLLKAMAENQADFTLTFRRLSDAAAGPEGDEVVRNLFINPLAYDAWATRWRERLSLEPQDGASRRAAMQAVNPAFIPRNHRVEAVIQAAVERGDFAPFEEFLTVLSRPYEDQPAFAHYSEPPEPNQRVYRTFCGT
ncbi:protein adenylyltransferase SelO [Microvirga roseola]|uniref:protein adenylyltransferase SelO n=1 Tax=Microvirga roseola TaxID=2883126 RepID=UPI001E4D8DE8|nr:YdiU family protein [Microvirga roseola]